MIDALSDHIALLDDRADIVAVNTSWQRFAEANGLRYEEYGLGANYLAICDAAVGPDAGEAAVAAAGLRQLLARRQGEFRSDYSCHSPAEKRWFQLRATCLEDDSRFYVVLAHQNFTEIKQNEQALLQNRERLEHRVEERSAALSQASEQLQGAISERQRAERDRDMLAAIVESSEDVIISKNLEGIITSWNASAEKLFGYRAGEAIGQHITLIIPADKWPEETASLERLGRGERIERQETVRLARDGRRIDVYLTISPVHDATGAVVGASSIAQDITVRKRAEEALLQAHAELESRVGERTAELAKANDALRNSERRLAILAAATFEGIAITERGRFVDANDQLLALLGYPREELLGLKVEALIPAPDQPRVLPNIRAGREGHVEHEMIRKDGSRLLVEAHGQTVEVDGRPVRFTAIRDITERRRIEEALRESERRFRTLSEWMPQLVWTARPDGQVDYVSSQGCYYMGFAPGETSWDRWQQAIHPEDRPRVLAAWRHAFFTGTAYDCDVRLRSAQGSYNWFKGRALPLRDDTGQIVKWIGTCTDINDMVAAREAMAHRSEDLERVVQERTAELRQSIEELEHFSYALLHDMRAPLRAMVSFAGLMERDCVATCQESRTRDYLGRIRRSAERMDNLVQDALNYAKVLRRDFPLRPVALLPLLQSLIESYPALWPHQAEIRLAPNLPVVLGNEAVLTECFSNLLRNAVTFVAPGVAPKVLVRAESRGENARIWVEDNGIGIPRDSYDFIFVMFQRLHTGDAYPGTGIGLAIVRKGIQRIGGQVGVESEPGQGSRFWVELKEIKNPDPAGSG